MYTVFKPSTGAVKKDLSAAIGDIRTFIREGGNDEISVYREGSIYQGGIFSSMREYSHRYDVKATYIFDAVTGKVSRVLHTLGGGGGTPPEVLEELLKNGQFKTFTVSSEARTNKHYMVRSNRGETFTSRDPLSVVSYAVNRIVASESVSEFFTIFAANSKGELGSESSMVLTINLCTKFQMEKNLLAPSDLTSSFPFYTSNPTDERWLEVRWLEVNQLLTNPSELLKVLKALGSVVDECTRIQKMPVNPLSAAMRADIYAGSDNPTLKFKDSSPLSRMEASDVVNGDLEIERARRFLKHMADSTSGNPYFFDDGYPKREIRLEAAAALKVLERLEKK
jgi:hypothetical protein